MRPDTEPQPIGRPKSGVRPGLSIWGGMGLGCGGCLVVPFATLLLIAIASPGCRNWVKYDVLEVGLESGDAVRVPETSWAPAGATLLECGERDEEYDWWNHTFNPPVAFCAHTVTMSEEQLRLAFDQEFERLDWQPVATGVWTGRKRCEWRRFGTLLELDFWSAEKPASPRQPAQWTLSVRTTRPENIGSYQPEERCSDRR